MSRVQIARELGVHRDTLYAWAKAHPEFKAAFEWSADLSQAWWEDQVRQGIWAGKAFNAAAWAKVMSCRFPEWRERQEVKHGGAVDINLTEVRNAIAGKLDRVAKSSGARGLAQ